MHQLLCLNELFGRIISEFDYNDPSSENFPKCERLISIFGYNKFSQMLSSYERIDKQIQKKKNGKYENRNDLP